MSSRQELNELRRLDQLEAKAKKTGAGKPQEPGAVASIKSNLKKRGETLADEIVKYRAGDISFPEVVATQTATGLGALGDIGGEAVSAVTPDVAKKAIATSAKKVSSALENTTLGNFIGDMLLKGKQGWENLEEENPRTARQIKNAAIIGTSLPLGRGAASTGASVAEVSAPYVKKAAEKAGSAAAKTASSAIRKAENAGNQAELHEIFNIITPKQTPTEAKKLAEQSIEMGVNRQRVAIPNEFQRRTIELAKEAGVSGKNSLQRNREILRDSFREEAELLKRTLSELDKRSPSAKIPKENILAGLNNIKQNLVQNPFFKNKDMTDLDSAISAFMDDVPKKGITASELLEARKKFDKNAEAFKKKVFKSGEEAQPFNMAVREVRQAVNDIIAAKHPQAGVRESLDKQFHWQLAADDILTKIPYEPETMTGRLSKKIAEKIPTSAPELAGIAGLGGAAYALPAVAPIAATIGLGYGGYKLMTNPYLLRFLATNAKKAKAAIDATKAGGAP